MKISKNIYYLFYFNFFILRKVISYQQGEDLKNKNRIDIFMETSAKSGFNVLKLFCDAAKILYQDSLKNSKVNKVR